MDPATLARADQEVAICAELINQFIDSVCDEDLSDTTLLVAMARHALGRKLSPDEITTICAYTLVRLAQAGQR